MGILSILLLENLAAMWAQDLRYLTCQGVLVFVLVMRYVKGKGLSATCLRVLSWSRYLSGKGMSRCPRADVCVCDNFYLGTELGYGSPALGCRGTELGCRCTELGYPGSELGWRGTELGCRGTELGACGTQGPKKFFKKTAQ
eukprot:887877-Rhodomonas_salina.2